MRIYLAAPLFSQMDRIYNRRLAGALEEALAGCEVILPQDFRVADRGGARYNDRRELAQIFRRCEEALRKSDLVLARLDGADADSGAAFEVGYAAGLGKPVLGLRTDYRQLQFKGLNVMLAHGCTEVACLFSFNEDMSDLARVLARKIGKMTAGRGGGSG